MQNDEYRNSGYMDDDEYRRMRQAEKEEYYVDDDELDDDEWYPNTSEEVLVDPDEEDYFADDDDPPEAPEPDRSSGIHDLSTDFLVVLPHKIIRIPQDSNLGWLTMFYALPRELVGKRPAYLELPRHITKVVESEKYMNLINQDVFLEMVWDSYAWGIWQALKVPKGRGGYKEIPGDWKNYSGDFPLWRMCYDILRYFRMTYETEMEWSFQRLFTMPENMDLPWMSWRHFCNLIFNLTDRIVEKEKMQPIIDAVWENRQPEDYTGHNLKRGEFLRKWNHSRNHEHMSIEQLIEDKIDVPDMQLAFDRKLQAEQLIEQFSATLTEKDNKILDLRMLGRTMQEIADIVGYETPSAVKKRIDRIAEQYEAYINPLPDGAERISPQKRRQ